MMFLSIYFEKIFTCFERNELKRKLIIFGWKRILLMRPGTPGIITTNTHLFIVNEPVHLIFRLNVQLPVLLTIREIIQIRIGVLVDTALN